MRAAVSFLFGVFSTALLVLGLISLETVLSARLAGPPPPEPGRVGPEPQHKRYTVPERRGDAGVNVTRLRPPVPASLYTQSYRAETSDALSAEIRHLGERRRFHLLAPRRAWSGAPVAAIVLLHGTGRSGLSMIDIWSDIAEPAGLVLIAPDAVGSWQPDVDDAGLVEALLEEVSAEIEIDRSRLYLFGHSDGAGHALRLANESPEMWRAVAVHGGAIPPRQVRERAGRMPDIDILIGTEDGVFPLDVVHSSARALAAAGHATTVTEIRGHTHWLYDIGDWVSEQAWVFLRQR